MFAIHTRFLVTDSRQQTIDLLIIKILFILDLFTGEEAEILEGKNASALMNADELDWKHLIQYQWHPLVNRERSRDNGEGKDGKDSKGSSWDKDTDPGVRERERERSRDRDGGRDIRSFNRDQNR